MFTPDNYMHSGEEIRGLIFDEIASFVEDDATYLVNNPQELSKYQLRLVIQRVAEKHGLAIAEVARVANYIVRENRASVDHGLNYSSTYAYN